MDIHTFGNTQAAYNLIKILDEPEYQRYSKQAGRKLSLQIEHLNYVMAIEDKATREATLIFWKHNFIASIAQLPEIVRTHILSVATAHFRKLWKESKYRQYIIIESDGDGFHAYCPPLKGLHTCGDTKLEALRNVQYAISAYLTSVRQHVWR